MTDQLDETLDEELDEGLDVDPVDHLTSGELNDLVEADPSPGLLTYTGQDFDVSGLVRRLESEDILIPTFGHSDDRISSAGFQRAFVWRKPQMDRFIESILLGYPIPSIFLVRQGDRRYLVLDGHQRLRTLQRFAAGVHEDRTFSLKNVATRFKGLTYKSLPEDSRRLFDDTFIPATIVATDGSPESLEAVYQIFERLNSGGTQLTPHEVRVALFAGPLIDFAESLNSNEDWRTLYGPRSPRLRDQELVLRILALFLESETYHRPLKTFLNDFTGRHRALQDLDAADLRRRFTTAAKLLNVKVGRAYLRPGGQQLNAAFTDAVFVALMERLAPNHVIDQSGLEERLIGLAKNEDLVEPTTRATADEETVKARLAITREALSNA
jgi:hypothetical protein